MARKEKPTHRRYLLIVEGSDKFPIDMLRYDSCSPADETDARLIQTAQRGMYRVRLRRFCEDARPAATARWQSFGWRIVFDSADPESGILEYKE